MNTTDTIAAIAGGLGGAISIVRISGDRARAVARRVARHVERFDAAPPRTLSLNQVIHPDRPATAVDQALFVFMPGPASYTGDDVAEIQGHGGNQAARATLEAVLAAGARLAEPGEFTFRAFVNGKMDLTQAEAVGDIINARHTGALHLAERQLTGRLGQTVRAARERLIHQLAELESRLDFPEEELGWPATADTAAALAALRAELAALAATAGRAAVWRDGVRLVLAGRPNSGKSSLLNYLLGRDRAIVTPIAGTTRDTLEECVVLRRIPFVLTDTAGLREADNPVEVIGIERSRQALAAAQLVVWLLDAAHDPAGEAAVCAAELAARPDLIPVWNKIDALPDPTASLPPLPVPAVALSAQTGAGIESLLDLLERRVWQGAPDEEPEIAVNARHAEQLRLAIQALDEAAEPVCAERWEVAAVFLHLAVKALGVITGETADPDLLDNIFSRFCLGK